MQPSTTRGGGASDGGALPASRWEGCIASDAVVAVASTTTRDNGGNHGRIWRWTPPFGPVCLRLRS